MSRQPASHAICTSRPDQAVSGLCRGNRSFRTQLVFVTGSLAPLIPEIAQGLAVEGRDVDWLLLPAVGAITQDGELEGESAVAALGLVDRLPTLVSPKADLRFGQQLCDAMDARPGTSIFVGVRGDEQDDGWFSLVDRHFSGQTPRLFGGGLLPRLDVCQISDGIIRYGAAGALILPPSSPGLFASSSACRLISPLRSVTRARGPVLHEIDGMLALERLAEATSQLEDQPLVLLAIGAGEAPLSKAGRSLALRAIQGVDPSRGALIFNDSIPEGARVAFAIRDAHAARADLEAQLNTLKRKGAGAAPAFGIIASCAGRGRGLYGAEDVDLRLIKKAYPEVPLVGMHSTFELAPLAGRSVPQIYTAVLGVFSRPS